IMTEAERQELTRIWNASNLDGPNSLMNGTLITEDAQGTEVRYTCCFRNRGHGSRTSNPHGFRIDVPNDRRWKGVRLFNLNTRSVHSRGGSAAICKKVGLNGAYSRAAQVRLNNVNEANSGAPMFGSYA